MASPTLVHPLPLRHKNDPCCVPTAEPSLNKDQARVLATRFKALGDETRLRLLDVLAQEPQPMCVCDITPHFSQNQPTISHHLRLLREAGLIDMDKCGIWSYYWATEEGRRTLSMIQSLA